MNKNNQLLIVFLLILNLVNAQEFKFGKVTKAQLKETEHPFDPDASASYVLKSYTSELKADKGDGFYLSIEVKERIKIYSSEGYEYANKLIKLYKSSNGYEDKLSGLKGVTYTLENNKVIKSKLRRSEIFKVEKSEYVDIVKFALPNIKEGSIIEISYEINSPFLDNIDDFRIQEEIPVDHFNLFFSAPEYFMYKTHQKGWLPFNIQRTSNRKTIVYSTIEKVAITKGGAGGSPSSKTVNQTLDFKENVYIVNKSNVPALKKEPLSTGLNNYLASIKFELSYTDFPNSGKKFYTTTWQDVAKNIYEKDSFGGQLTQSEFYQKELLAIEEESNDQTDKILNIYEFIKDRTIWNGYNGIYSQKGLKSTFEKTPGNIADINLLLVSMLKAANIDSYPILVSTIDNGIPLFPTENGFNYVICGVNLDKDLLLLDATNKFGVPNILQKKILNWKGLAISENGNSSWISLYPQKQSLKNFAVSINLSDSLTLNGKFRQQFTGYHAMNFRKKHLNSSSSTLQKYYEDRNIELFSMNVKDLNHNYKPVQISFDFESDSFSEIVAGEFYFSPLLFLSKLKNDFKSDKRKLPVFFGYPTKERINITIQIPSSYKIKHIPASESIILSNNYGTYHYLISEKENTILINVERSIKSPIIDPMDYEGLKNFFEAIVNKESEKIVLTKA